MHLRSRTAAPILVALLVAGCRKADEGAGSLGGPSLAPSGVGVSGCVGPNQVFSAPQAPVEIALATLAIGSHSQLAAAQGAELLYATGAGATVVEIDLSGPTPVETEIVGAGTLAALLATAGIAGTPELSGLAVLDATHLVAVEHASNTLVVCDRITADTVEFFAGLPSATPGFADGLATGPGSLARFSFTLPTQVAVTAGSLPSVLVADPGNHAVRLVAFSATAGTYLVSTLAGGGTPGFADGQLSSAAFDTPSGITLACNQLVIVSERGDSGLGQRLRSLLVIGPSFFGGYSGDADTVAGTGTSGTSAGSGATAEVARPLSPFVAAEGDLYWVDSATGVLRRKQVDGDCDCPLAVDCATAVSSPDFPAGDAVSLTQTTSGVLYALDATAGKLLRVTP